MIISWEPSACVLSYDIKSTICALVIEWTIKFGTYNPSGLTSVYIYGDTEAYLLKLPLCDKFT